MRRRSFLFLATLIIAGVVAISAAGCKSSTSTTTAATSKPGSGAVVNSDSLVTAGIISLTKETTGYAWKMDVLIQTTINVNDLPNPVAADIGKVVTVYTDENLTGYYVNDAITGQIKYVGDVNIPGGIKLNMFNIEHQVK